MKINSPPTSKLPSIESVDNKPQLTAQNQEAAVPSSTAAHNVTGFVKMEHRVEGALRRMELEAQLQAERADQSAPDISKIELEPAGIFSIDSGETDATKDRVETSKVEFYAEKLEIKDVDEDED